ncbi:MAG: hypothetical protein B0W54_05020 [Cellvibrio sp. 79]|nr:MAG: hypothetical protein B0W54_05020 [Cellvibrio sp. 79]
MFKEFKHHIAWTDAMAYESGYAGIIGYQRKFGGTPAHILWVLGPHFKEEADAERSAQKMLEQIAEISCFERVIYADGIML